MKNVFKLVGIIALVALVGFSMAACGSGDDDNSGGNNNTGGGSPLSAKYDGKDVLSNSYSLSIGGSNVPRTSIAARYARAAVKNDSFSLDVKGRDGKSRSAHGKVKDVNTDGTLTLETDDGVELTAVVDNDGLDSIASDGKEVTFDDKKTLTPRTFDNIYLRANRWSSNDPGSGRMRGEQLGSGLSVLVKDFPTNVSRLEQNNDRYTITISGTVDRALPHVSVEVQGLTENDEWVFLANNTSYVSISAGTFNKTITMDNITTNSVSHDLLDYKEIILQVTDVINMTFEDHPDWGNVNYGSLPAGVPNGQIMATIGDFKISLKDKNREAFKGNTNDNYYGFKEDGFSVDYRQAVWNLTPENIASVKKPNAKFEFILMDNNIGENEYTGPTLDFIWQDPVRGL